MTPADKPPRSENIILSKEDFEAFEKVLENPPEPCEALIAAIKKYALGDWQQVKKEAGPVREQGRDRVSRIWFTSDHHFYHNNVIKYCARPFADVETMNEALVKNWNEVVGPDDVVYYLGDFSMAFRAVELFSARLNGIKKLIPGNHDFCHSYHKKSRNPENQQKWIEKYEALGWKVLPEQFQLGIPGLANFQLCHHPYFDVDARDGDGKSFHDKYLKWRPYDDGRWLLCGHVHEKWKVKGNMINVGVDVWDYAPVSLEQIKELILEQD